LSEERRKQHKGYVIFAHPEFLTDYQKWHIAFTLEKHYGSHVNVKQFYVPVEDKTLFSSEKEATEQSFVAGAQTIDSRTGLNGI